MAQRGSSARAPELHSIAVVDRFRKARMAGESRDTRLLAEVTRPWVDALSQRFGPSVETRLIKAALPLVEQYLAELKVAPKSDEDRKLYVARVVFLLAYHWWRFVEPDMTDDKPQSSHADRMAE